MDTENLSEYDDEVIIHYQCRLYGLQLHADDRDAHRQMHQNHRQELHQQILGNAEQNVQGHENATVGNSITASRSFLRDCGELSHSFECGVCSKTFKEENEVEEHRRNHTTEEKNANRNHEQERNEQGQGQNFQDNVDNSSSSDSHKLGEEYLMFECRICHILVLPDQVDEHPESEMHRNLRVEIRRGRIRIPRLVQE